MQGVSVHWFAQVFQPQSIGDIRGSFDRSLQLGLIVMLLTVVLSFLAGLAFRKRFTGSALLFYVVVASLIMPSVVVSLGIGCAVRDARDRALTGGAPASAPTSPGRCRSAS